MHQSDGFAAEGDSPIPAADRQALQDNLLEGLIRQAQEAFHNTSTDSSKVSTAYCDSLPHALLLQTPSFSVHGIQSSTYSSGPARRMHEEHCPSGLPRAVAVTTTTADTESTFSGVPSCHSCS